MAGTGTGERQTKAQRKEAARREREEIQRRMARQRRNRRIGIAGGSVVVAAAIVVLILVQPGETEVPSPSELLRQAPAAAGAAGCDEVQEVAPYRDQDQTHLGTGGLLTMPPVSTYPSVPPTSGPHNPTPLPQGIYSSAPPLDQAIHSLEHGAAIVWYDPSATGRDLDQLRTFYREYRSMPDGTGQAQKIIVAPYDYPDQGEAGRLPAGTQMALDAWHRLQTCARVSLPVAFDFTAKYVVPPFGDERYRGEAPEPQSALS